jgi:indolepyruvate decarboxylase
MVDRDHPSSVKATLTVMHRPATTTLAESLLAALRAHGVRQIFGIPGDFALPLFKAIESSATLPLYTLSHEPAVGFAADAAARMGACPGVAVVTYGAGALNMLNAVTGAYAEKSPLVVISGAPGRDEGQRGLLLHHQAKTLDSQLRIMSEVTCDQAVLDDAGRAPSDIARVLRSCIEQSRPVYVELPRDMVDVECATVVRAPPSPVDVQAVDACADEVLERLDASRAPVVMVGVEIRRYRLEEKVTRLCRHLGIPAVTSFMGRGLLADSDAPLIGTYMGVAGSEEVTLAVESSDALLLLGVLLSDTNFGVSAKHIDLRHCIVAADREVYLGFHLYPRVPLGELIDALLARVGGREPPAPPERSPAPRGLAADDAPIEPLDIARAVNDGFDAHGPMNIACDMGDCLFTAMDIRHVPMAAPGYYATMGFGVPAGLGLQAATGQRALVLVGDGAFQMTGWELGNCRRYGWDPIVVVFNNASWEMLRTFQPETGYNDLDEWQFARMAEALGGDGHRVRTRRELRDALGAAMTTHGRFQLVEVMLERGAISPTLKRFVHAIKASSSRPHGN